MDQSGMSRGVKFNNLLNKSVMEQASQNSGTKRGDTSVMDLLGGNRWGADHSRASELTPSAIGELNRSRVLGSSQRLSSLQRLEKSFISS